MFSPSNRFARGSRAIVALGGVLAVASLAAPAPAVAATPTTVTFPFKGAAQTWIVPQGVHQATFQLVGAAGGSNAFGVAPGLGVRLVATIDVTPGETLQINVGGQGGPSSAAHPSDPRSGTGGWNGGGNGGTQPVNVGFRGGGGGGATDLRRSASGTFRLADRVLVAGGGGGNEYYRGAGDSPPTGVGGDAGAILGEDGVDGRSGGFSGCTADGGTGWGTGVGGEGGSGGAPGAGGAGGVPGDAEGTGGSNTSGTAGTFGHGGDGGAANGCADGDAPGGGGGGWFGGGGGGGASMANVGGGGGGGSSHGPADAVITPGAGGADGSASVTFQPGTSSVVHRSDGRIRVGTVGGFVGNDVYGMDGVGQRVTGSAIRGKQVTFGVSIQNDGNGAERMVVAASGEGSAGYTVSYARGVRDVTASVVAGTYKTAQLAPGATELITVHVKVMSSAAAGSRVTRLMWIATSNGIFDVVQFTGKRH